MPWIRHNSVQRYRLRVDQSARTIVAVVPSLCVHSSLTPAATNTLTHDADIAKVPEW